MRKCILLYMGLVCTVTLLAQEKIYIHKSDQTSTEAKISNIDSIYFSSDGSKAYFRISGLLSEFAVSEIDSVSFIDYSSTIFVTYSGTTATVINPLASAGVSVSVKGADVTVNSSSENTEINYSLKGTATDGSFKVYSTSKFNLKLNGVSLTNSDGPAVNIQSKKKCNITLEEGTTNTLTDGSTYATSTEDQKSTLFSEGQIDFDGTGSLTVKSNSAHAICSDDYIDIQNGNITVSGATKDGVHANDYFTMTGGTLNVTSTGDGVECESGYILISGGNLTSVNNSANAKGLTCDSTLIVSGGTIKLTLAGNQSKGIKSDQKMTLSGGTITINTSGGVVLATSGSGYDPAYCTAIKNAEDIEISGSNITIVSTGAAGKGISSDKSIVVTSGNLNINTTGAGTTYKNTSGTTDSYSAACLSAANINVIGGTVTTSSSGAGGKGFKADTSITIGDSTHSPTIGITTSGSKFAVSSSNYCHPKAIVCDGSIIINNGNTTISSSDDGIHAETAYTQNNGNVTISNSYEGVESFNITLNNGNLNIVASNDGINATAGTVSGGTESNDGSSLNVKGGTLVVACTGGDAIDSNGNINISGGTTIANGPNSGVEEAADFNGTFNMKGGLFIGAGSNSTMTKSMSTSSTQVNMYISSSSLISSSTLLHIQNASGTDILTFKSKNGGFKFLFSSTTLSKESSYSIYTGGSYTGGTSNNGLYSGGTYSTTGATLKKTVSMSSSSTVNTISF
jgi:trimeric autotransporter adhesin